MAADPIPARMGSSSTTRSKTGELTRAEHERIRLHAYLTGRIFANSPVLAPLGVLGSSHHERHDGSGYHRGLAGRLVITNVIDFIPNVATYESNIVSFAHAPKPGRPGSRSLTSR
jgi:hypothetical protein